MNIEVYWANAEKTILHYIPQKGWAWEDVDSVMVKAYRMMDESDHPVYNIVDFTNKKLLPKNPLVRGKRLAGKRHPNTALIIFVADNNFFKAMFSVFNRMHPAINEVVRFANTIETAHTLIEDHMKNTP